MTYIKCPVCHGEKVSLLQEVEDQTYEVKCQECDCVFRVLYNFWPDIEEDEGEEQDEEDEPDDPGIYALLERGVD
jgi:hypothetical protein